MNPENETALSTSPVQAEAEERKKTKQIVVKGGKTYAFFKRAFDIFCSFFAILVFSIPMIIVAILVKMTSKGPVIYVSTRIGKNGKKFRFYKFRSMCQDAEQKLGALLKQNEVEGGVTFKMKDDPRITKFGHLIRKTSLDELPQLFNILKGDMSIVGPRPCTEREYNLYTERDKLRLLVPQGLTGEWQAKGRSNTSFEKMIDMDLDYIQNKRSFFYDIHLIFLTVVSVFRHEGAE